MIRSNEKGNKRRNKKTLIFILILIFLTINFIGAIAIIIIDHASKGSPDEYTQLAIDVHLGSSSVDFDALKSQNPDICAWLLSDGTGIDHPIVQGGDNEYYRTHLFSGQINSIGCIFVDHNCSSDFSDKNTIIYGGKMLDTLFNYTRQDYYELQPSMTLCTPTGTKTLLLFAGMPTNDISGFVRYEFKDDADFENYIDKLFDASYFTSTVSVRKSDSLITICADNGKEHFVLVGKLV